MINRLLNLFKKNDSHKKNQSTCSNDCVLHNFPDIDDYLFQEIFSNNIAVFAGAGISTETKFVFPKTFYEQISQELNLESESLSFPELMERYTSQVDGKSRLIRKIQNRFDHLNSFGFTRWASTRFHRELSTLYPIKTIITTNWDLYFEQYCRAIPFVHENDMAFWDSTKRNVLKIHGSINSYGSIIATSSDYAKAEIELNRGGLLGSKLKTILSEKNIIFIGYSFSDSDFQEIYNFTKKTLGKFHRQSYVVTPFESESQKFKDLGFITILSDGTDFIAAIKEKAVKKGLLIPDEIYEETQELLSLVTQIHIETCSQFSPKLYPHMLQCMAYQDGMIDALERAISFRDSGEYSNPNELISVMKSYDDSLEIREERKLNKSAKEILDIAYIEGYSNALTYIALEKEERPSKYPPLFYLYRYRDINITRHFKTSLKKYPKKHHNQYRLFEEFYKSIQGKGEYHHPPTLFNNSDYI